MPVSGDLRLGGRFQLQGNAGGGITRCAPPRHLAVTWEFGGQVSWVDVRLFEEGVQREFGLSQPAVSQHLRVLRESGFATVPAEGARRVYLFAPPPLEEVDAWLDRLRAM